MIRKHCCNLIIFILTMYRHVKLLWQLPVTHLHCSCLTRVSILLNIMTRSEGKKVSWLWNGHQVWVVIRGSRVQFWAMLDISCMHYVQAWKKSLLHPWYKPGAFIDSWCNLVFLDWPYNSITVHSVVWIKRKEFLTQLQNPAAVLHMHLSQVFVKFNSTFKILQSANFCTCLSSLLNTVERMCT